MSEKLKSRKFWFALLGALLPIVAQGLTEESAVTEALQLSIGILGAYIFGQAYVDGQSAASVTDSSGSGDSAADVAEE